MNGYTNGNGTILSTHVERLDKISSAVLRSGRRRAADTAIQMSQRGAHKAAADRCNAAALKLIELAFEEDDCGRCNVGIDGTFNQRISMPWSSRNYGRYALQRTEAAILKLHVDRLQDANVPPLFIYFGESKRWSVNVEDYGDLAAAVGYWRRAQLNAKRYADYLQTIRNQRGG